MTVEVFISYAIDDVSWRGLGGVGKTQLANEYTHRFREEYRYVFWPGRSSRPCVGVRLPLPVT